MNNLNLSQNSNNLNDSSKTQEKLYSNEASLDDILTYSDDNSQNQSYNKSLSNKNIGIKESKKKEGKQPIINSFNSEITISFLNQNEKEKINNIKNKEKNFPKSACKLIYKTEKLNINNFENKKFLNKSCNNNKHFNLINLIKNENDLFEDNIGNNLRDVSDFHASISNIFSEFEIKDISISKSNNELKKNNSEKDNNKLNNIENYNKIQISEEHSNTNSMCNYQNISNINDISRNTNKEKKDLYKDKSEKNKKDNFSSDEIGQINIKMNISLDNCNNIDKNNYLDEILAENDVNKKDNYTTSNKKETNSFYAQETKQIKNSIKYTKAQCVQALFQNKDNKQYILSDAPIKTKDTTSDKKTSKKIISLSPHKLSFEIQKNDCIQISYKKNNKNKSNIINNDLNNNILSINNNNSELSISKLEETNSNNNYFYNNDCLKQNNTTSFMISSNNNNNINKYIRRKISYQKNNSIKNKKIFINNRNINIQKEESNNFFYNPNHHLESGPVYSNISNNKKYQNELHTPDLNKNKMTPMTCVHKGSLIYCNETNGNNSIKYNYSNNSKGNKNGYNNKNIDKKVKLNNQKKLVYLKNIANEGKNSRGNKDNTELNSRIKQVTIINNKNNSFVKINNNENNKFNTIINKNKGQRKNSKINTKKLIKKKKISEIINNNNSKINNSYKKNIIIKNSINNNSINSNNNRRIIRGVNKIKIKTKSNSIINKINNEIIKESSLFHILYNMPQRNVNTTKNNSGTSSKDEKESTIIQKNTSKEKGKEKAKKISQKKLIKHNTNNSFSLYNSFFDKILDDSKKRNNNKIISKEKNKNKNDIKKTFVNLNTKREKSHKKIKSEINLDSLTTNFNFNNLNIMKRRKNNKSLYNFGNIFFINQNQIVKSDIESNNSNINNIKYINKKIKEASKNKQRYENNKYEEEEKNNGYKDKNKLIVSTKYNPRIINDFSKYRKKKELKRNLIKNSLFSFSS